MSLVINTNVASLNAQRNVDRSQGDLNTALQRLSTGLRINSAKDDAAGLAIATRFTTQINGLNQAVRNANDGISLAQTGEAALDEITNNLQRIRELAVQSANATNNASDRQALDSEVQQRLAEISRIAGQTSFNGQKLLDGSFGTATFQVGANVGETINVSLNQGVKTNQIGQIAKETGDGQALGIVTSGALTDGAVSVKVGSAEAVTIGGSASTAGTAAGQGSNSAYAKAAAINEAGIAGLTATASNSVALTFDTDVVGTDAGNGTYNLTVNGETIYNFTGGDDDFTLTGANVADAINQAADTTGVRASYNGSDTLTLTAADGRNIQVAQTRGGDVAATEGIEGTSPIQNDGTAVNFGADEDATFSGNITLAASENIVLSGADADIEQLGFDAATGYTIAVDQTTLSSSSITTVANSEDAILRVDSALTAISNLRSDFGAVQNRFESTITNLQTISENLSASRSRIQDADFAAETAKLTRAQILQQAGISILAQANSAPQSVLALLQ